MKDQVDFLRQHGIEAARLDSSLTLDETRQIQEKIRAGILKLLYVAPERFKNERFLEMIRGQKISLFAIDEVHCVSEWGHNFRPDYLKLNETAKALGAERILALTATATPNVVNDICRQFDIKPEATIVTGFYRSNLKLAITATSDHERIGLLMKRLAMRSPGSTIVYVTLQKTAEEVANALQQKGFAAEAYHAGMDSEIRNEVQERWMASDARIVVATIAFGMGIDKANVRYVYHYNLPKSIENYSQEIGRAGRDGSDSVVEMFACSDDIPTLENFIYGDIPTDSAVFSLVEDVMSRGDQFSLSIYELTDRHDIRPLVLKTALTYLELLGAIKEGAPFYAGYRFYLLKSESEVFQRFDESRAEFLKAIFRHAKVGKKWLSISADDLAVAINQPRQRIVAALDYLHGNGLIELQASDVRSRFRKLESCGNPEDLAMELIRRFAQREADEMARLAALLEFVEHVGCHSNALAVYFGEERPEHCGHCAQCLNGKGIAMPPASNRKPVLSNADIIALEELRALHPNALGESKQITRFLCGLSSPALGKARIGKHDLAGIWSEYKFADALEVVHSSGLSSRC